jgi:hypothetical protein
MAIFAYGMITTETAFDSLLKTQQKAAHKGNER